MHSVVNSATLETRARQKAELRHRLAVRARELAVERGFLGFTIEELCDDIGVSRRTFFNYFASKENAVLGRPQDGLEGEAAARFVAGGTPGAALSPTLLDGLVDLAVEHFEAIGLSPDGATQLFALLAREPKLFSALMEAGSERDRLVERLAAEREGVEPTDPRIRLAVQLTGTLARGAVEEALSADATAPFEQILRERLRQARALFTPTVTAPPTAPHPSDTRPEPEEDR